MSVMHFNVLLWTFQCSYKTPLYQNFLWLLWMSKLIEINWIWHWNVFVKVSIYIISSIRNRTVGITLISNRKRFILIMKLTVWYGDLTFSFVVVIYGQPTLSYFSRLNDTFNASSITILHHGLSTCHINKCGKINVKRV